MGKGGKHLQNVNQEIKELHDSLHELDNWVVDLHKQIDLKDKLIEALQLKLIEKEKQIENMVDATCDTNDLMQMVDVTCDTNDLMVDTDTSNDMIDDSLTSHENGII
jgi:predicted RNase H-like nuclease (RuvC/YqgF family)